MKSTRKKLFNRGVVLCFLLLTSLVAALCFRNKLLSLLCYCIIKIYASGLYSNSNVQLYDFRARYEVGGKVNVHTGIMWKSTQGLNIASVKNLKLKLDLSQLYSTRKLPIDLQASGLDLDLNTAALPELKQSFIVPRLVEVTDARVRYDHKLYDVTVTTKLEGSSMVTDIFLFNGQNRSKVVVSRSDKFSFELDSLPVSLLSRIIKTDKMLHKYVVSGRFDMTNFQNIQAKFYFHELGHRYGKDNVTNLSVTGKFAKLGGIVIEHAILSLPTRGEAIRAKGYIDDNWSNIDLHIKIDKVSAAAVRAFAGIGEQNDTKIWCARSIKDGELLNLNARLRIKNIFANKPVVQIKGQSKFLGLNLKYSETLPQIDDLNGEITFDEKLITFLIAGGKMIDTQLSASTVQIDLVDHDMPLRIKTDAVGPIKDFINFIPSSSLKHLEARKIKLTTVSGWASAHIAMCIPLSKAMILPNMTLEVKADLKQFNLAFLGAMNLKGDLLLKIENNLLSIIGSPLLNGEETDFKFESYLKDGMEFDSRLRIYGLFGKRAGLSSLSDMGVVVHGEPIPINIAYLAKESREQLSINANLDHAQLWIPYLGILKKASKAASFDIAIEKQNDVWKTKKFEFIAPEESIKIEATAEFKQDFSLLSSLNARVKSIDNNLSVDLTFTESEYKLHIKGSSIISNRDQLLQFLSSKGFSNNAKLSVFINLDRVTLKYGVTLDKISGRLSCYKGRCTNDTILMKIKDGNGPSTNMKIYNEDGAFIIQTDNAAALLKGLDLYNELQGGSMSIKLYPSKNSSKEAGQMRGVVQIRNFHAIKTPLISKLILLTPFSQIVERLKGETLISFRTLDGSFLVKDKILEVYRSTAYGDFLTVTINGHIDLLRKRIALKGRIIPNSLFNNLLLSIQNNKELSEQYKMGTDYKIEGSLTKPRVIVSPIGVLISLLTKPLSII